MIRVSPLLSTTLEDRIDSRCFVLCIALGALCYLYDVKVLVYENSFCLTIVFLNLPHDFSIVTSPIYLLYLSELYSHFITHSSFITLSALGFEINVTL